MLENSLQDLRGSCVALIGGGGKTSLLRRLGKELAPDYPKMILTSLTQSFPLPGFPSIPLHSFQTDDLAGLFTGPYPPYITGLPTGNGKYSGISEKDLSAMMKYSPLCVFECDGARNLPLKAHNDQDPRVPAFATHVIVVIGADVVNTRLSDGYVHRPALFRETWGIKNDMTLDISFISRVVTSDRGYLNRIPHTQRPVYFVNKADTHPAEAESLGHAISAESGLPAYWGSLQESLCYAVS